MQTQTTIRNCPPAMKFVCPQRWDDLTSTDSASERFCQERQQTVYLCRTDEETIQHAIAGHCIARQQPDESELPESVLGIPEKPVWAYSKSEQRAMDWSLRERGIYDALRNADAERMCPECGYAAPDWRTACRVCGCEFGRVRK